MKDTKVERARQAAAMLRRQFLQGDAGVFAGSCQERCGELHLLAADHPQELLSPNRNARARRA